MDKIKSFLICVYCGYKPKHPLESGYGHGCTSCHKAGAMVWDRKGVKSDAVEIFAEMEKPV